MKIENKLKIDGNLNEEVWKKAQKATDFLEINPTEGKKALFPTEVSILYDNYAIYVGAFCFDSNVDSLQKQMGERDEDLNVDLFTVSFDTYDKKLDAFVFSVSASNVQSDYKLSDYSYNAVWKSQVNISENGWSLEMEIPFSALRFSNSDSIVWNVQFEREIRRIRSQLQWSLVSKSFQNPINYWGKLKGLKNLQNPLRLQLSPYLSTNYSHFEGENTYGYGGGTDLKVGLNEAFTLDLTLLPDFSQVQSDNIIKNLSAFEVVFQEQRPFFQEGVELFNLGNLFYSRRIGGVPLNYYNVNSELKENEIIKKNPNNSNLINVTKISGRTKNGLGIGFLNALSNETFAVIEDTLTFSTRKVLTNPLVNYQILAIDKNLPNNSSVYFINLNAYRSKGYADANVSAFGWNIVTPSNSYSFTGNLKITQVEDTLTLKKAFDNNPLSDGSSFFLQVAKIKGAFRYRINSENKSPRYDPNDLGVNFQNNYRSHNLEFKYNKFNPFWKLNHWYNTLNLNVSQPYDENIVLFKLLEYNTFTTLQKSFHSFYFNIEAQLGDGFDPFEARVINQYFVKQPYVWSQVGVSSDYRRKIALDANFSYGQSNKYYGLTQYKQFLIAPIFRMSDKLTIKPSFDYSNKRGDVGFAGYNDLGDPIYGQRDVLTITNVLQIKYLFKNNLSLTLRLRHYWSKGTFRHHGVLNEYGLVVQDESININTDFNFNAFNSDLIFMWQVAPGSFLNIVYKNSLLNDKTTSNLTYWQNIERVFDESALNKITVKFIYFVDWASLKRNKKSSNK
ncbi:MAG: carbohydrate binding family 9 domain-containing protein [Flavobacteriia bacterium]|nr:carbohydrate binding family 9 domain-containing protein [Flavobacteriia bacterium]